MSTPTPANTVSFDSRAVTYGFGELDTLVPAYAATIHKSQGSEYPAVVIPVLTQALRHAAAEPALYRCDPRQATGCAGRPEEGGRDCRAQRVGTAAVVEIERVVGGTNVDLKNVRITLEHGPDRASLRWPWTTDRRTWLRVCCG
jgi:hypothetical protein